MVTDIYNIVNESIKKLEQDNSINSIFIVGSMASEDYKLGKNNDLDIRFIVTEVNTKIRAKISDTLENIKKDINNLNYGCKISEIIGPVKMHPEKDKNILLHAITMTKKDLNNLPNIHKYSYSCNYKQLYGKDFLDKYKEIILTPFDVIESVEGIDYCIDLIHRKKIGFSEWINKDNEYTLKYKEKKAYNCDMVELFSYSYNKAINNVLNMIDTNNIVSNLSCYLDYNEYEKKLINKIENKILMPEDIDKNKDNIITILLKLEKACLNIYKNKKYYNSLEWGIIDTESEEIRNQGFIFLKQIGLPMGNNFTIKYEDLNKKYDPINNKLINSNYLVLFEPKNNKFKRYGISGIHSIEEIETFMNGINCDFSQYSLSFIERIMQVDNSFAGTLLSDGKGNTFIEIMKNTCDSRNLTSTGVDSNRITQYKFVSYDDCGTHVPKDLIEIKKTCQYFKGYYEFAYGRIRDVEDIYFTFYSDNNEYINIFEGGKTYGKTLRNR